MAGLNVKISMARATVGSPTPAQVRARVQALAQRMGSPEALAAEMTPEQKQALAEYWAKVRGA